MVSTSLPWLLAIGLPLLLALALLRCAWRPAVMALTPWSALPALVLALQTQPGTMIELPWLLLGARLGVDSIGQIFLALAALLWLLSGIYARSHLAQDKTRHYFFAFYLVTMSGNLGLILAQDMLSFFLFFALMSFASYGLIVHNCDPEAVQAGRIYIVLVIVGEVLLFTAMVLAAGSTGSLYFQDVAVAIPQVPARDVIIALTLAGFGIKVGALPLHVWLPPAYSVSPIPANAVSSGAMIKAGLLGWLRLLPLGEAALPAWGTLFMVVGLAAAFYGVAVGITQNNPKTVLAYSSISQMGLITVAVGVGLAVPTAWPLALAAILLYAVHHALAKGALFLGVGVAAAKTAGVWQHRLVVAGLLLPALALAGAPLTSGAIAKALLKTATAMAPTPWPNLLGKLLPLAAVGTTLLMGRFLFLVWPHATVRPARLVAGLWLPWAVLVAGVPIMALLLPWNSFIKTVQLSLSPKTLWTALWPVGAGVLLVWGVWELGRKLGIRISLPIPAGDLLVPASRLVERFRRSWRIDLAATLTRWPAYFVFPWRCWGGPQSRLLLLQLEGRLGSWTTAGMLFLLLAVAFFVLLAVA